MRAKSGAVLYSGRSAFESPSDFYILGLNPGGDPDSLSDKTICSNINYMYKNKDWSSFEDEEWSFFRKERMYRYGAGLAPMQRRVRYLAGRVGFCLRCTPVSNVIFERSRREIDISSGIIKNLESCWRFHEAVIQELKIQVVICLGKTAGHWVRKMVGADFCVDCFEEQNDRGWISFAHRNSADLRIVTLTHPSVVRWCSPPSDPSDMVKRVHLGEPSTSDCKCIVRP